MNNYLSLKIAGSDAFDAVEAVSALWSSQFSAYPFESWFLDDNFNKQYQSEERLRDVFSLFSMLAVFIACLGLFGLSAFTAQQRTKEIGIRKIMGASVPSLVTLLSREFALLVLVGLVVAVPATVYGLNLWLEPFPYRTDIAWWVFALSGMAALAIALVTVGYQANKAASGDLVSSLRNE